MWKDRISFLKLEISKFTKRESLAEDSGGVNIQFKAGLGEQVDFGLAFRAHLWIQEHTIVSDTSIVRNGIKEWMKIVDGEKIL